MSVDVRLAAMMPASRAVCTASPFFSAPARTSRRAAARHPDAPARHRLARGDRLVADVHHPRLAVGADVRQADARPTA